MMNEQEFKKLFARNLNYFMDLNSKTQSDLSSDLQISKATISSWCNGTRVPRMDKVDLLCSYFGIKRSDLMEDKSKEQEMVDYYLNSETKQIAQEIFENPEMKALFDMSRKMDPQRLRAHLEYLEKLYQSENPSND